MRSSTRTGRVVFSSFVRADWFLSTELKTVPNCREMASVGGMVGKP